MQRTDVMNHVQDVVRDVLENESVALTDSTVAQDVPDWDSLAQVRIMVAIEKRLKIRFDTEELSGLPNVGALVDAIVAKTR